MAKHTVATPKAVRAFAGELFDKAESTEQIATSALKDVFKSDFHTNHVARHNLRTLCMNTKKES